MKSPYGSLRKLEKSMTTTWKDLRCGAKEINENLNHPRDGYVFPEPPRDIVEDVRPDYQQGYPWMRREEKRPCQADCEER
uniref:Uncharacterized protein n=1 Tax=Vespula pensylvanica TaxID=30213 RepID=A0A834NYA9_VESPE|nr:hypothetical protein H0235_010989 [Vespula pensylvanica]